MCKHGTLKEVRLNRPREVSGRYVVPVDACIADEIQMLNDIGIITYGCCCGHGETFPQCLVDISSKEKLEELGYELFEYSKQHSQNGIYQIKLKIT